MVEKLRRIFLTMVLVGLALFPFATFAPVQAYAPSLQHKAVILSSLEQMSPMGFYGMYIERTLTRAGYQVTFLADRAVTLDFLTTQLNNYDLVIWRTNQYNFHHTDYWYVGEIATSGTRNKYSTAFTYGWVNANAGVLGISTDFMAKYFSPHTLTNVKLMVIIASNSNIIANFLISAGAKSVVSVNGYISLYFGLLDDLTAEMFAYLGQGKSVYTSVYNTVAPYSKSQVLQDPLDSSYSPPFWFIGDGSVTIT